MALAGRIALPAPAARPRWRGRPVLVAAVLLGMGVAFLGWRNELTWPASLVWHPLPGYLDHFQNGTWTQVNGG